MALAMRDRFGELAASWRRRGWELTLGIGVAQGFATIGVTRIAGRMDYGAMGRVMGAGYALCDAAKNNRIFVTGKVAAAVETVAEMVPIEGLKPGRLLRRFEVFEVLRLRTARVDAGE
jgi:class 3 adenylate cyclase